MELIKQIRSVIYFGKSAFYFSAILKMHFWELFSPKNIFVHLFVDVVHCKINSRNDHYMCSPSLLQVSLDNIDWGCCAWTSLYLQPICWLLAGKKSLSLSISTLPVHSIPENARTQRALIIIPCWCSEMKRDEDRMGHYQVCQLRQQRDGSIICFFFFIWNHGQSEATALT